MKWESFLKNKKIKVTRGRISLLNIIESSNKGLSAEELYYQCKKSGENLNLSTIYRSLELFEENKIIKKISVGDGPSLYMMKSNEHNHTLQCDVCNKEVVVPCPMEQIEEIIKLQVGFSLIEHKLELKGICDKCKK